MNMKRLLLLGALPMLLLTGSLLTTMAQDDNLDTVRIAFIGRENGRGAELDRQLYQAAVTAADQINAGDDDDVEGIRLANGDRYALEVVYYPADTTDDAIDALDEAVTDDAVAVLGPHEIEQAEAIRSAGTQGLPLLLGAPDSPDGENLFRLTASLEDRAQAAADYLVNERHMTRIAVFSSNTDVALAGTEAFKKAAGNSLIVADIIREADEEDFSADVQQVRDEDAEALFIWALDGQTELLLGELRDSGWDGEIVFAGLDADFVGRAGADLTAGLYGLVNWTDSAYDSASQTFVADYQEQWGSMPPEAAASYYDAIYLLADSISDAGLQPSAVRGDLAGQTDFAGVQGTYDRAETDTLRLIQVASDGGLIEVARYAAAACQTCPDIWWADNVDEATTSTSSFRIGLIGTLDGASEGIGDQIEQAARLAVREINEAGGIIGANGVRYTLDLVTYSAETGEAAGSAFEQAISDGVQLIIGPDYNAQVIPNLFRADNEEVIQLVSATSDQVTINGGSYVYQLRATDATLANAAAEYLLDVRELTRFATVAVQADYGLDALEVFGDAVRASDDGEVALELEHDIAVTDFAAMADQIVNANVEAVAMWSTQPAFSALAAELSARDWDGVLVYGYLTLELSESLSQIPFEIVGPVNWWMSAGDWVSQDFSQRYAERYGTTPIPQAASYYDAIYLIAAQLDGSNPAGIRAGLNGLESFIGVQGSYRPERYKNGELTRQVIILSLEEGVANTVARYDDGQCLIGCGS